MDSSSSFNGQESGVLVERQHEFAPGRDEVFPAAAAHHQDIMAAGGKQGLDPAQTAPGLGNHPEANQLMPVELVFGQGGKQLFGHPYLLPGQLFGRAPITDAGQLQQRDLALGAKMRHLKVPAGTWCFSTQQHLAVEPKILRLAIRENLEFSLDAVRFDHPADPDMAPGIYRVLVAVQVWLHRNAAVNREFPALPCGSAGRPRPPAMT
jgi:hypothetical protein